MDRLLLSLILVLQVISSIGQEENLICKDLSRLALSEQQQHQALLEFRSSPFTDNYDLKYHRFQWAVDPAVQYISGTVTTYFEPREDAFEEINFDLSSVLTVNEVTYHGQLLDYIQHPEDRLQIFLPQALSTGQMDSITIDYEGAPPQNGFGSFSQSSHNGTPIIWTLSEPYGAKDWWPCKLDLNDKIDSIEVIVRTPSAFRVASNGVLISETEEGPDRICHWKHRYPIPSYLIAIGVTNYEVYSDFVPVPDSDPVEVLNYVYPESAAQAQAQTGATVNIMQFFNERFGLYPFADEKYGHAQFGFGGGMEHQTMSFMGGWSHSLQAHELAHQWFGDKITCGSWEDIWLNEGFATYLDGLTYENELGPNDWQNWLKGRISSVTSQPGGSVFVTDTTNLSRIFSGRLSYSKGAMLLHMLRWKLGDSDFFQAVRNYLDDPDLAFAYAHTEDIIAHLENQSGQDLTEFFADWFYGEGYPSYHTQWSKNGQMLTLKVEQTTSHPSVDFFEMPISFLLQGAAQDSLIRLDHQFSGQEFSLTIPFELASVTFDPNTWIISAGNTVNQVTSTGELAVLSWSLQVFPNPVRELLTISFEQWNELPQQLILVDGAGKTVGTWRVSDPIFELDCSRLPSGSYFIRIPTSSGIVSRQILVE